MDLIAFYGLAGILILSALGVVGSRNPMHSVMLLIVSFGALAGLYILLDAPFTAVTQIIIYAGAIMVLFLFVVMLLNAHTEEELPPQLPSGRRLKVGALLSLVLAAEVMIALSRIGLTTFGQEPGTVSKISSVQQIGVALFTVHSFAFEVTSVLILVAMVGAVVIARREH